MSKSDTFFISQTFQDGNTVLQQDCHHDLYNVTLALKCLMCQMMHLHA